MKPMGALQPGITSPTTLPQNWHIIIIDLQDCFFAITLYPIDRDLPSLFLIIISGLINYINGLYYLKE